MSCRNAVTSQPGRPDQLHRREGRAWLHVEAHAVALLDRGHRALPSPPRQGVEDREPGADPGDLRPENGQTARDDREQRRSATAAGRRCARRSRSGGRSTFAPRTAPSPSPPRSAASLRARFRRRPRSATTPRRSRRPRSRRSGPPRSRSRGPGRRPRPRSEARSPRRRSTKSISRPAPPPAPSSTSRKPSGPSTTTSARSVSSRRGLIRGDADASSSAQPPRVRHLPQCRERVEIAPVVAAEQGALDRALAQQALDRRALVDVGDGAELEHLAPPVGHEARGLGLAGDPLRRLSRDLLVDGLAPVKRLDRALVLEAKPRRTDVLGIEIEHEVPSRGARRRPRPDPARDPRHPVATARSRDCRSRRSPRSRPSTAPRGPGDRSRTPPGRSAGRARPARSASPPAPSRPLDPTRSGRGSRRCRRAPPRPPALREGARGAPRSRRPRPARRSLVAACRLPHRH